MSRKPYPTYKPSGVEWLGDVPKGWLVERLKFSATSRVSNVDKLSGEDEIPVRLCNYVDVYKNDEIIPELPFMEATATPEEIKKFGLRVGDVLITKDSEDWRDIAIPAYVRGTAEDLVCGYHLAIVRASERRMKARYLFDLFRSRAVNTQFQVASSGVTRYGLPKSAVGEAWVPIPPKVEQEKISAFIEIQTRRIDELIAKKRELIERLKEKRTALISHVVTKGLPPEEAAKHGLPVNPPLKPSGVPWLGEVPEHWSVSKIGYNSSKIGSGKTPDGGATAYVEEGIPFIRSQNVYDDGLRLHDIVYIDEATDREMAVSRVRSNDVLLNITGASLGRCSIYPSGFGPGNVNQHVCIVRTRRKLSAQYLHLYFTSQALKAQIQSLENGSSREGLNFKQIGAMTVLLPPLEEQTAISAYLSMRASQLDTLAASVHAAIDKLQEYRSALITAAVTGKIDVREEVTT
jgi:type I restriction enzyme S subunit